MPDRDKILTLEHAEVRRFTVGGDLYDTQPITTPGHTTTAGNIANASENFRTTPYGVQMGGIKNFLPDSDIILNGRTTWGSGIEAEVIEVRHK